MAAEIDQRDPSFFQVVDGLDGDVRNQNRIVIDLEYGNPQNHFGGGLTVDEYFQIIQEEQTRARTWLMKRSWGYRLQTRVESIWRWTASFLKFDSNYPSKR